MFEKILVAANFDDLGRSAFEHALGLARAAGAKCHLLHAIEPIEGAGGDPETRTFYDSLDQRASDGLEALSARCREADVPCEVTVRVGRRWQAIVDVAGSWGADLIVVGSRPTLQDGKLHLGSTSHQVFFAAPCSVLVVRPTAGPSPARGTR